MNQEEKNKPCKSVDQINLDMYIMRCETEIKCKGIKKTLTAILKVSGIEVFATNVTVEVVSIDVTDF